MTEPRRVRLLNPGPVTLTETVRSAMLGPDLCHREQAFSVLMAQVRERLRHVYPQWKDDFVPILVTGSGTSAVEAMVGTLVSKQQPALVCANGVYGERIAKMLSIQGKPVVLQQQPWTEPIDLDAVDTALENDQTIRYVIAVHHETTTGRMNDLDGLGEICQRRGRLMLVDAVSSFGGAPMAMDRWNAVACAATANKCLHGVPGVAFVLVKRAVLEAEPSYATSLYLDLFTNYQAQEDGYPAFTPAVQSMYALQQALIELESEGGWRARARQYQSRMEYLVKAMCEAGFVPLLDSGRSDILVSFRLPQGIQYDSLYRFLREHDFVIYPGQKHLLESIFRIAVMGDLHPSDLNQLVELLSDFGARSEARCE